ncbi:MAG: WhiB family transcriptional regulator [Mycobacterium sp.]|nr:WhiB family transcriptional regulator [Mycobacterium sp.]
MAQNRKPYRCTPIERERLGHQPINLLIELLRGTPKLEGALCPSDPEAFDLALGGNYERALEICDRCPARKPCAEWAAGLKPGHVTGVIAGTVYRSYSRPPINQPRRERA